MRCLLVLHDAGSGLGLGFGADADADVCRRCMFEHAIPLDMHDGGVGGIGSGTELGVVLVLVLGGVGGRGRDRWWICMYVCVYYGE